MLTKKSYILLAKLLKDENANASIQPANANPTNALEGFANALANALEQDNPRFNKAKFMQAGGF